MNIIVKSRMDVESGDLPDEPFLLISITCPDRPYVRLRGPLPLVGKLDLKFSDIDRKGQNGVLFTKAMAKRIWDFVEKGLAYTDIIVVHCEAGISRSAGVAAALAKTLNGDDTFYFMHYLPNRHVYRLMLQEAQTREG